MKLAGFAGILLALHFLGFFGAMRFTSVATGTALASLQPIFAAIYLRIKGASINRLALLGMFVAFGSLLFITGIDFTISRRSFIGDLFAITSGALSAAYILIGSNAQKEIATSTYTTICFTSCAITVLPIILISGSGLINFGKGQWLLLGVLIIGAQFLGHTLFNFTLKRISPVVVSLIVFFEVPVAALVALLWLHQKLPFGILPGIIGLMTGCAIFIVGGRRR